MDISGTTHLITLLGNPTSHSLSPAMHNLSFNELGIDAVYLCFDVDNDDLGSVMSALKSMDGWDGANVTMPCKQAIIPHLDKLDTAADLMGAVNVLKKEDGCVTGYNTDGAGFMQNLRNHGVQTTGARMTLLGVGGAGGAIMVQAALDGAARIDAFVRPHGASAQRARDLAKRVTERCSCDIVLRDLSDASELKASIQTADILVNATSVGMGSGCTDTLVQPEYLHENLVVADVIYHPRKTQLILDAESRGCKTVEGLGMLLQQAAEGEAIWYGVHMPSDLIKARLFE